MNSHLQRRKLVSEAKKIPLFINFFVVVKGKTVQYKNNAFQQCPDNKHTAIIHIITYTKVIYAIFKVIQFPWHVQYGIKQVPNWYTMKIETVFLLWWF